MKRIIFLIGVAICGPANAQKVIYAERPKEMQSPQLLDTKTFQLEAGYFRESRYPGLLQRHPELNFRYGLSRTLELRFNVVNETQYWKSRLDAEGFHPVEPGIKLRLGQSRDSSLSYALQANIGVHWIGSRDHNPGFPYYKVRFIMQGQLTDFWDMNVNIGRDWDHGYFEQNWIYGFSFEFEMNRKLKSMLEFYGQSAFMSHTNQLRTGIGYAIRSNLAFDASVGVGLNEISPDFTLGAGVSWRILK